jgi:hypothetical protein
MRDIYATTMKLVDIGGGDAFEVACERAMDWAWRIEDPRPDLVSRPAGLLPVEARPDQTTVQWWSSIEAPARALELRLRHQDTADSTLQWLATVTISDIDGTTRATVRLERGASVHVLRPWHLDLRAPLIVLELMRSPLLAYAGSLELAPGPRVVSAVQVEDFVADVLHAADRALPVLIVSSGVWPNLTQSLARALAGLVQIARLEDQDADEVLGRTLRKSGFTIPPAGMRLYWPGFGLPGQPSRHPYWTASQIREGRDPGQSVVKHLVNLLAPISTGRVPADPGVLRARRERLRAEQREQRRRQEAQREHSRRERERVAQALARAQADKGAGKQVDRLQVQLTETTDRLADAEAERDAARSQAEAAMQNEMEVIDEAITIEGRSAELVERVAKLESENAALHQSVKTIATYRAETEAHEDEASGADPLPQQVSCWDEVAEHMPALAGPGFALSTQAEECAEGEGRYPHPASMWRALRALERVGRVYNEQGAELGMRFEEFALQEGGLDVALQDSTYEEECFFEFEGQEHSRLAHVKIDDAKAANEVGRIYFALDPEHNRLIVDWFGTKPDRPRTARVRARA